MRLISSGPEETEAIGYRLGRMLKAGDVVALYGDLGAGKTTMVKGIARAFGIGARDVTSASFTIIAEYRSDPPFYHIDLYRIRDEEELDHTGFWECIGGRGVAVIEWAEKIGGSLDRAIRVRIGQPAGNRREIDIEGLDEEDRHHLQSGKA